MRYQVIQLYLPAKRPGVFAYVAGLRVRLEDAAADLANEWLVWFRKHYEELPTREELAASNGYPLVNRHVVLMYQSPADAVPTNHPPWQQIYMSPVLPEAAPFIQQIGLNAANASGGAYEGIQPGQPMRGDVTS